MRALIFALAFSFLPFSVTPAKAAETKPVVLEDVGLDPKLGSPLPLNEQFLDEQGRTVTLGSFFDNKVPVVIILNYYSCPMLCGLLLNGARDAMQAMDWRPGDHYKIVTISINPKEDSDLAAAKKSSILNSLKQDDFRTAAEANWHFLVGKGGSEARIAAALGFRYKWIEEEKQYAHSAALFLASPDGHLSRVLQGIEFSPRDLKLALLDAGQGKVGTFAEKFIGLCYHYDPKDNKYALLASRLVSLGGAVTVAVILLGYLVLYLRNRRKGTSCSLLP